MKNIIRESFSNSDLKIARKVLSEELSELRKYAAKEIDPQNPLIIRCQVLDSALKHLITIAKHHKENGSKPRSLEEFIGRSLS